MNSIQISEVSNLDIRVTELERLLSMFMQDNPALFGQIVTEYLLKKGFLDVDAASYSINGVAGISGVFTVKNGSGVNKNVTVDNGLITAWEV